MNFDRTKLMKGGKPKFTQINRD